ncbi:MAG: hypothetical protein R6V26_08340 [Roseovarius sp.]
MKRRALFTTLMAVTLLPVLSAPAKAQQMNASEIEDLLAGNTIKGAWSGEQYRQYFAEDGATVYVADDGEREHGRWRVDRDKQVYESWWPSTGWIPYAMVDVPDGEYAWLNGDRMETFEVEEGRRIE